MAPKLPSIMEKYPWTCVYVVGAVTTNVILNLVLVWK
jgi:hypothetical protein